MERIIDLNERLEGSIDLDSDHGDNLHWGSAEAEVEGSAESQEEGSAEPEVGGSTEPVIEGSAEAEPGEETTESVRGREAEREGMTESVRDDERGEGDRERTARVKWRGRERDREWCGEGVEMEEKEGAAVFQRRRR
ncbi:hypothetical protein Sjap_021109 [Stephania japonica]|uniref:Uncharacterized protein n=1 Tax=Stephania japonica TaxID=461633 RepID=A0AAP0F200_9MAGN